MKFTKEWFKAALMRCIRTAGQTAVAAFGTTALLGSVDWMLVASMVAMATVICFANCVASLPEAKLPEAPYEVEGDSPVNGDHARVD